MSPLGRGLASLIPRRTEEAEEEQDLFQQLEGDDGELDSDAFFAEADSTDLNGEKVEVTMDEDNEDSQEVVVEEEPMDQGSSTQAVSPLAFSVQAQEETQEQEQEGEAVAVNSQETVEEKAPTKPAKSVAVVEDEEDEDEALFMLEDTEGGDEEDEPETELPGADEEPMAVKPKVFVSENRTSLLAHEAIVARQAREQEAKMTVKAEEEATPEGKEEILTEETVEETPEPLADNPVVPPEEVPDVSETGESEDEGGEALPLGQMKESASEPVQAEEALPQAQGKQEEAPKTRQVMAAAAAQKAEEPQQASPAPVASASVAEDEVVAPAFGEVGASDVWNQHEEKIMHVAIGDIRINPLQPRRQFEESNLDELRDSIDRHGILQPLVVRRLADDEGYELIAGERRLRAAKSLQWSKVPCVVRKDVKSDQSRLVYALIENIQRQNLNPVEEALAYQQLNTEYGLTHEEIGERVGKSRVAVTNAVRVLQLPAEIQRGLSDKKISIGHAKAILMIPDKDKQIRFYRHLVEEGVTVRKAEIRARRIQRAMKVQDPTRIKNRNHHPLAIRYTPPLESRYGYGAKIKYNEEKNRFDVLFQAHSEKDLDELVSRLMGASEMPEHDRDIIGDEEA